MTFLGYLESSDDEGLTQNYDRELRKKLNCHKKTFGKLFE